MTNGLRHLAAMIAIIENNGPLTHLPEHPNLVGVVNSGLVIRSATITWRWHPGLGPVVNVELDTFSSGTARTQRRPLVAA